MQLVNQQGMQFTTFKINDKRLALLVKSSQEENRYYICSNFKNIKIGIRRASAKSYQQESINSTFLDFLLYAFYTDVSRLDL